MFWLDVPYLEYHPQKHHTNGAPASFEKIYIHIYTPHQLPLCWQLGSEKGVVAACDDGGIISCSRCSLVPAAPLLDDKAGETPKVFFSR